MFQKEALAEDSNRLAYLLPQAYSKASGLAECSPPAIHEHSEKQITVWAYLNML